MTRVKLRTNPHKYLPFPIIFPSSTAPFFPPENQRKISPPNSPHLSSPQNHCISEKFHIQLLCTKISQAMTARASLIAFYSPPLHHNSPPDILLPRRILAGTRFELPFRIICSGSSRDYSGSKGLVRLKIRNGRLRADVKSKPYDLSDSEREALKFEDTLDGARRRNAAGVRGGESSSNDEVSWLEQFPKRWIIVLLCFSAFLLCNMDRVSLYLFFLLFRFVLVFF